MVAVTAPTLDFSPFVRSTSKGRAHIDLLVSGVHCANCIARIEKGLRLVDGVDEARVNFSTGRLSVDWNEARTSAAAVVQKVEELGFGAKPYDAQALVDAASDEGHALLTAIAVAGVGVVFVAGLSDTTMFGLSDMGRGTLALLRWLSALIAVPVALFASRVFLRSAVRSLAAGSANMDVPISLAILISLGLSLYATAAGGSVTYYDAAVMLPFLLLIGRYLDYQLRRKAGGAALDLVAMQATQAVRFDADGNAQAVAAGLLVPGDCIALATGERSPVDGVLAGDSEADLSLVTGETGIVSVRKGEMLHAGSLLAGSPVRLRVTARVQDSLVAELARLIEAGQQQRSRYVRLADRAAALYVPTVHCLALLVFLGWFFVMNAGFEISLTNGIALLIITCPCALGLAVPAVQIVATGQLFRRGVLVKSGDALERLADVDTVVFDKTGTLTDGQSALLGISDAAMLPAAARLARASRHPLARALAAAAGAGPVAEDASEHPGQGVVAGNERLGSAIWVGASPDLHSASSHLYYRKASGPIARFAFGDRLRVDARQVVNALAAQGLAIRMLSGDQQGAAARIALEAGISSYRAGVSPEDKVAELRGMRDAGRHTLMVGDGLNDAAAIACAHVSISPGTAMDATKAQADIILRGNALMPIAEAIDMARKARSRALQNFAIAILYNAVAVPLAAMGLVTPLIAAVAMASSSLVVTLNALRLSVRS